MSRHPSVGTLTSLTMIAAVAASVSLAACGSGPGEATVQATSALEDSPLVVTPLPVRFGVIRAGTTATEIVTVTNRGTTEIDITSIAFPPDPCRAELLGDPAPGEIVPCVLPGESRRLAVTCAPARPGDFGGTVGLNFTREGDEVGLNFSHEGEGRVLIPYSGTAR